MEKFKDFLRRKSKTTHQDLGKECIIYENIKGMIVGVQNSKYWVKVKGMQRQLVEVKDIRIIED